MIAIGCDHGGFRLKEEIRAYLERENIPYKDFGVYNENSVNYPDKAFEVCEKVASGEYDKGILICGTGIGISIAANKVKGIRAALCSDCFSAKFTRLHNDANVLCMGGRTLGPGLGEMITDIFLHTEFEGGRHQTRIDMISNYEEAHTK